jgi:nematocidal protein AidA
MSKVIDIEIVVDTVTLLKNYPNPSKNSAAPTGIGHQYGYMVAPSASVVSGQATGDLTIKAEIGDVIRWRMLSLTGEADQAAVIYNIARFSGTQVTSSVQALLAHPLVPEPILVDSKNTNPPTYNAVKQDDYYLSATVTDSGTENYNVQFYVTERSGQSLNLLGYFVWDPTIQVA